MVARAVFGYTSLRLTIPGCFQGIRPALARPAMRCRPMQPLLYGYLPILVFLAIAGLIAIALVGGSLLAARQKPYPEKLSAYECGFEPFGDARRRFDVRYYLVAILFIIFDLEVAFLFPWAVALKRIGAFGFWSMLAFLGVLTAGFIYEWCKGALEWE
jgi:NADH-quinone oxidoreductase subunit A